MGDEAEFKPLSHEILAGCLSEIKLAIGGGGYVFTKVDCTSNELTTVGNKLETYAQIRHIILAENKIADITPLNKLPHLLTLHMEKNAITSLACLAAEDVTLPWLQRIDFSDNKLTSLPSLGALEKLRFAYFARNEIASLEGFGDHPALEELVLAENQLTTLNGMGSMPSLVNLVLAGNQLSSLEGLNVPALTTLDLQSNSLASLEHLSGAPLCKELNLSGNKLDKENPNLPELKRLGADLKNLRILKIAGNDVDRIEALLCAPKLKAIDDEPVTQEDKDAVKEKRKELAAAVEEYEAKLAAAAAEAAEAEG